MMFQQRCPSTWLFEDLFPHWIEGEHRHWDFRVSHWTSELGHFVSPGENSQPLVLRGHPSQFEPAWLFYCSTCGSEKHVASMLDQTSKKCVKVYALVYCKQHNAASSFRPEESNINHYAFHEASLPILQLRARNFRTLKYITMELFRKESILVFTTMQ